MINVGAGTYVPADIDYYGLLDIKIGRYCSIGSGLKIYSGEHACIQYPSVVSTFAFKEVKGWDYPECKAGGFVTIGDDVWIATDVRILEGVTIGTGAIIGAGSVVTKDVPPYAFVAGNPATIKSFRFEPDQILKLLEIHWWSWKEADIQKAVPFMKNVDKFIAEYLQKDE